MKRMFLGLAAAMLLISAAQAQEEAATFRIEVCTGILSCTIIDGSGMDAAEMISQCISPGTIEVNGSTGPCVGWRMEGPLHVIFYVDWLAS